MSSQLFGDGPSNLDAYVRWLRSLAGRIRQNRIATTGVTLVGLFSVLGIVGPVLAPHDPTAIDTTNMLARPSLLHPMGTDNVGRDIFSRVLTGARVSLIVAVSVPIISMLVGVPVGLIAGYYGGVLDNVLMRFIDSLFAFPALILGLTLVAIFGQGLVNVIIAISIVYVPQFARITRGAAISASNEDHVVSAEIIGASDARIIVIHVLPFCVSPILVQGTITAAAAILIEAALSFLGVGVPPPNPTWGRMLDSSMRFLGQAWWFATFPGLAIIMAVLGINLLGDGLRDILDPRMDSEGRW
jgi:ABC-type dipeptide/oligopeptide/nickel transport system permease subunit